MSLFDQISQQHYRQPPAGWQTNKIKFLADIQTSNVDKLTVDNEEPVRLCNYTDVYYNDRITPDLPFMEATATPKEIEKFTLQAGQVFITKDSEGWDDIGIPALVTEDMPGVLCGYHLAIFTPDREKLDGAFLAWLCRADALNDQFKLSANGVTRFGLGQYPMKNAVVGYPPLEAQKRIATFLDKKTTQIDGLIAKKQALLERLAEKRQAIITQAVTKGLDTAVSMKDSGIDWLGKIPGHWEVKRLKLLVCEGNGLQMGPFGGMLTDLSPEPTGFKLYGQENTISGNFSLGDRWIDEEKFKDLERYQLRAGDLVITRKGSLGSCRRFPGDALPGVADSDTIIIRFDEKKLQSALAIILLHDAAYITAQIESTRRGAILAGLNSTVVGNLWIACPPSEEQRAIIERCETYMARADQMIAAVNTSIKQAEEYRSALITAAVTGQIEGLR